MPIKAPPEFNPSPCDGGREIMAGSPETVEINSRAPPRVLSQVPRRVT